MLLACDIGNSSLKVALFSSRIQPVYVWNFPVDVEPQTLQASVSDAWGKITAIALASVNLEAEEKIKALWSERFSPIFTVTPDAPFSFHNRYQGLVGTDRLCACEAAKELVGIPVAVFSFGTALTVSIVNQNNEFIGGWIFPGIQSCWEALSEKTALIPEFPFPQHFSPVAIGKSTQEGVESGIFSAFQGIVEKWRKLLTEQFGNISMVCSGGMAEHFAPYFSHFYPHLVVQGIYLLYCRGFR